MEIFTEKRCACSGIRSCLLCEAAGDKSDNLNLAKSKESKPPHGDGIYERYLFCIKCKTAWQDAATTDCSKHKGNRKTLSGIDIIENFVSSEEESFLCTEIDKSPWTVSQSGRRKQDYGPKVNFKKKKLKPSVFTGLPDFSSLIFKRMQSTELLKDFIPVELCHLEYTPTRGSSIDPHFDDFWVWGPRLVTLNLCSDSVLTFTNDHEEGVIIDVPMPARSLIVVGDDSRYLWKHAIDRSNIRSRRIACTFRELTPEFIDGEQKEVGNELMNIALSFNGSVVS